MKIQTLVRNTALEEAAALCDAMAGEGFNDGKTLHFAAKQIRKLKQETPNKELARLIQTKTMVTA